MMNHSYTTLGPDTGLVNCNCYTVSSSWDYGNGVTDTVNNPAPYTYDACGEFISNLTVTDSIGCTSTATEPVYVIQLTVTSFNDTTLCISAPMPMDNTVSVCPSVFSVAKQFNWTQNMPGLSDTTIQTPTLMGLGLFIDTLTVSYPGIPGPGGTTGCAVSVIDTVDAVMGAVLTGVTPSTTISYGSSITLNSGNEVIYYWVPNDGSLDNPNINDPIATPSVTTTYTVYGLDANGCLDSAYVTIYVDTSSMGDMPTAFTPNHDGTNDVFRVVGAKFARMVEMRVYNRWGEEIFYTNDRHNGWDGTFHGVPQDMGVYNYSIIIANPDGQNVTYKGTVTLIR
jgi:gliding motility-associated-like protein